MFQDTTYVSTRQLLNVNRHRPRVGWGVTPSGVGPLPACSHPSCALLFSRSRACLLCHKFSKGTRASSTWAKPVLPSPVRDQFHVETSYSWAKFKNHSFSPPRLPPDVTVKRSDITFFSSKSRSRLCDVVDNSGHHVKSTFTCSYGEKFPPSGRVIKKHLRRFLQYLCREYGRGFLRYLWILEFQKRGAAHYHIYLNLPVDSAVHSFLVSSWCRAVGPEYWNEKMHKVHSHHRQFKAWSLVNSSYLVKNYLQKAEQKDVPEDFHDVGRFWGHSTNMKPVYRKHVPDATGGFIREHVVSARRATIRVYEKRIDQARARAIILKESLDIKVNSIFPLGCRDCGSKFVYVEKSAVCSRCGSFHNKALPGGVADAVRRQVSAEKQYLKTRRTKKAKKRGLDVSVTVRRGRDIYYRVLNYGLNPELFEGPSSMVLNSEKLKF